MAPLSKPGSSMLFASFEYPMTLVEQLLLRNLGSYECTSLVVLCCAVLSNQSILSAQQSRWAKEMLSNIRKACCVAGGMNLVAKEEDVLEVRGVSFVVQQYNAAT
jgi:hypothetical protein